MIAAAGLTGSPLFWVFYIVIIIGFMYFISIRPQRKQ